MPEVFRKKPGAEQYEDAVDKRGNRTAIANVVVDIAAEFVPPVSKSGNRQSFLDIAAGTGIVSRVLEDRGYAVTAFDVDQEYLGHLRGRSPEIKTVLGDLNRDLARIRSGSFAGITSVWANRFITDPEDFLRQTQRILRPGGVLVLPTFAFDGIVKKLETGKGGLPSQDELMSLARAAGFSEIDGRNMSLVEAKSRGIKLLGRPKTTIVARK